MFCPIPSNNIQREERHMKAIAIVLGTAGSHLVERPVSSITAPDEVKIRVIRVGICGTDREEVFLDPKAAS